MEFLLFVCLFELVSIFLKPHLSIVSKHTDTGVVTSVLTASVV
jgi:hypothetical protein